MRHFKLALLAIFQGSFFFYVIVVIIWIAHKRFDRPCIEIVFDARRVPPEKLFSCIGITPGSIRPEVCLQVAARAPIDFLFEYRRVMNPLLQTRPLQTDPSREYTISHRSRDPFEKQICNLSSYFFREAPNS